MAMKYFHRYSSCTGGELRQTVPSICMSGWIACFLLTICAARSQEADLAELSLEDLMSTKVELVSRKTERLVEAPAAIYVVARKDIRRAGATTIAEALRLVPGVQVGRIDAHTWAISARGFNGRFANKLLVQVDGRSIYTPLFSGVYWEAQDVLLEDVERVEVIRGPGATLWGANAVNGIINIVTRKAQHTQGNIVVAGVGFEERGSGILRHGGKLGEDAYYRIYAKYFERDEFVDSAANRAHDGWTGRRGGFRLDWERSERDALTLQGDLYGHDIDQTVASFSPDEPFEQLVEDEAEFSGGHILGRWKHRFSPAADLEAQLYWTRFEHAGPRIGETRNTLDVDVQHRWGWGHLQEVVWGGGWRLVADELDGSFALSYDPEKRTTQLFSAFVQDDISFAADRLHLILGSKLERDDFTGFALQPNLRLMWFPHRRHSLWGAWSRAMARCAAPVSSPAARASAM